MEPVLIKRELKASGYRWEMRGKKVFLVYTKEDITIPLTKVAAMSLVKFLPNYLDKMRIEENKMFRAKIRKTREKAKAKREVERAKKKKKQLQLVSAKANKVKHE